MSVKQKTIDAAIQRELEAHQAKLTQQAQDEARDARFIQEMENMEEVPADLSDEQVLALNRHLIEGYRTETDNLSRFKPGFRDSLMNDPMGFGLKVPPSFQRDMHRFEILVNQLRTSSKMPLGVTMPDITYVAPEAGEDEGAIVVTMLTFTEDYEVKRQDIGGPGKMLLSVIVPSVSRAFNTASLAIEEGKPVGQLVVPVDGGKFGLGILNMDAFEDTGGVWVPAQEKTGKLAFQYGVVEEAGTVHFNPHP